MEKEGRLQMCPDWTLLAWGCCRQTHQNWKLLRDWLGVHIWFPLIDPKLKVGQKLRKLSIINQVLAILGWLLEKLSCSLLDWHSRKLSSFLQIWLKAGSSSAVDWEKGCFLGRWLQVGGQSSIFVCHLSVYSVFHYTWTSDLFMFTWWVVFHCISM